MGVTDDTLAGNIYYLRFSTTSVRGSETETKLRVPPADELRCIEVIVFTVL